ncbi:cation:proton antiporter [Uliginosibacterium gangwonense]|uniref:cation:proton antiporter n=1 Tax=Uliginosibacterium gangwonense TaxID=392736 RepID=UPI00036459A3|nr:cation:proton antiporter [Uliginosibacterium gangwonense]
MIDLPTLISDIAWPLVILLAWCIGEYAYGRLKLPRISTYALVGFLLAPTQLAILPPANTDAMLLLANIAFGLILFECGHRINLAWLRANPWIGITSITESCLTFVVVYALSMWWEQPQTTSLLLATLSMASSPAAIIRVINEHRSAGQVSERAIHLSTLNCVLAVFAFKVVVGLFVFQTSGELSQAIYRSGFVILASVLLGIMMSMAMPTLLRLLKRSCHDATLAFALAVILLVSLTHSLKLSPVLAALTFGLFSRHRRAVLNYSQRGFGTLGDLFSVLLFVFVAASLEWRNVQSGILLGFVVVISRQAVKIFSTTMLSHVSGISWKKGIFTGLAMAPLSVFVILVLEQTRHIGVDLVDQFAPLAAAAMAMELFGPILTWLSLRWSHEIPQRQEG